MAEDTDTTTEQSSKAKADEAMTPTTIWSLGIYLPILGLILLYLAFVTWPPDYNSIGDTQGKNPISPVIFANGRPWLTFHITYDQRLLLMVLILGALGSYVHVVTSFADYAGNRRLVQSWAWWYLLRPFSGTPIALAFYFAVRGGFMTAGTSGGDINRFGIAALAVMVGMFSLKATDKLQEVFDVLFKTQDKRKDALENGAPVLKALNPRSIKVKTEKATVALEGANFARKAVVLVNGKERTPIEAEAGILKIALTKDEVSKPGSIKLAVKNPPPDNRQSAVLTLPIER